jgi:hypothetical protein
MSLQQIMEMMEKMDGDRRAFIEWMKAKMKATQAETKAILAEMKARREKMMEAQTNDDRNEWTACQDVMEANPEKMEPNTEENEAALERQRVHKEDTAIQSQKDNQNETTADNKATEKIETDPGMLLSIEEHQDVPIEDFAVMPVKGLRKRRRGRKSTAGRRGEPKELIQGNCGCRRKLAAACRKVSRHATVAWRKRNLFGRNGTKEYCGSWRIFAAARKGMARCEGVARRGVHDGKRYGQVNVGQEIKKRRKDGNRLWKRQECNSGIWNAFLRHQLQDPDTCQQLRLRMEHTSGGTDVEFFRLENEMPTAESFMALRKMKKWRGWKDRPPPKRKKKLRTEREPVPTMMMRMIVGKKIEKRRKSG